MVKIQDKKDEIKQKTTAAHEEIMEIDQEAKDLLTTELDWDT